MANLVKISEICPSFLPITERRYRQLSDDGIVPKPDKGMVDLMPAIKGYIDYQDRRLKGEGHASHADEKARLTRLSADKKELDLQRARGELIPTDDAMSLWSGVVTLIKSRLDALPRKTAPLLFGCEKIAELQDVLEKEIDSVERELSEPDLAAIARSVYAKRDREDHEGDERGHVAAKAKGQADRKRVGGSKQGAKSGGKRRVRKVENSKG